MKRMIFIFLSCFFVGCLTPIDKGITHIEPRILLVYDLDHLVRENDYTLTITQKDSLVMYDYKSEVDSTKNMSFKYLIDLNKIYFGPNEFSITGKSNYRTEYEFSTYNLTDQITDGMGDLIFSKEYGVLAFENGWGMQFHYLTKVNREIFDLPFFYK